MRFLEFENFLLSKDCFKNHDVSCIDRDGNQHYVKAESYPEYQGTVSILLVTDNTIKIEQYEKQFGYTDRTAHIFYNKANGPSFGVHTDPVDVLIECLDGVKTMEVEGKEISLEPHDTLFIPANTPHRALNYEKALMISYGINDTETLSNIR